VLSVESAGVVSSTGELVTCRHVTAQPYQQESEHTSSPSALRWLVALLAALLIVLIVLPAEMTLDRAGTGESIMRDQPSLSPGDLDFAINMTLAYTWLAHAFYGAVTAWLVAKVLRGRPWARVTLTVVMVLASLNSLGSAQAGPEYYPAVIAGDVLHLAVIVVLWGPKSVRRFFTAHRRRRASALPA
jgi:hypothetical protein